MFTNFVKFLIRHGYRLKLLEMGTVACQRITNGHTAALVVSRDKNHSILRMGFVEIKSNFHRFIKSDGIIDIMKDIPPFCQNCMIG